MYKAIQFLYCKEKMTQDGVQVKKIQNNTSYFYGLSTPTVQ